jgi:hypothetical protein
MNPFGRVPFGLALLTCGIILGIGSAIYSRVSTVPQFCIDVMAGDWAKRHAATVEMYVRQQRELLQMPGADIAELNQAWQQHLMAVDAVNRDRASAKRTMEEFRKKANCV